MEVPQVVIEESIVEIHVISIVKGIAQIEDVHKERCHRQHFEESIFTTLLQIILPSVHGLRPVHALWKRVGGPRICMKAT